MNKDTLKKIGRHLWGWFTVCVWIVGVPHVCRMSVVQAQGAAAAAKCLFTDCDATPDDKGVSLGTMSEEEFKELVAIQKARAKSK
jgi:hypothetical protein